MKSNTKKLFTWGAVVLVALGAWATVNQLSANKARASQKNVAYDRVMESDVMTWGIKGDTKLIGVMDIASGEYQGFEVDLAKELTKRINPNAKAELTQVTAGTRVPMLLNVNIDTIIATMTITDERKKVVNFSDHYFKAGQSIMVPDNSKIKSVEDVNYKGAKILAVTGTNSAENIKEFAPKAQVVGLPDYATAMTALESGQGDAITSDNTILFGLGADKPNLKIVGGAFTSEEYAMAFSKNEPKLEAATNKALAEMRADGSYDKLAEKWFGEVRGLDWKEVTK
jgi:putative glutamine transport system substrate-binding protein